MNLTEELQAMIGQVLESTTLGAQTTIGTPLHLGHRKIHWMHRDAPG